MPLDVLVESRRRPSGRAAERVLNDPYRDSCTACCVRLTEARLPVLCAVRIADVSCTVYKNPGEHVRSGGLQAGWEGGEWGGAKGGTRDPGSGPRERPRDGRGRGARSTATGSQGE